MAKNPGRFEEEEESTDDCWSEANTSSVDSISTLTRGAGEMLLIRTLRRLMVPIFVPIFRPLVHQLVKHELAKREALNENLQNKASTSLLKKFKLRFRNKINLPVYTGQPLLGDNQKPIEIALVDAITDQIVTTGAQSVAKLEILGFRVGDDDNEVSWTYAELQEKILSERRGRRILQGNTCLQLKEGVGFANKFWFTHNSEHTRNGLYRLVAVIVDAGLMNGVEIALSETFVMKDYRFTYREKHPCPALSDNVYRLQQISHNGRRYTRLRDAEVYTVKDLLRLLYTDPNQLEDILNLEPSSKYWDDIVKNAQASNGMFLYLDPRKELKTGVVLDVKLQLKALIVEPRLYVAINQLTEQQKVEAQDLVKFASEHFDLLHPFDHEISLEEHLQSIRKDELPRPSLQITKASHSLNNSNQKPFVTTQSVKGKEKAPYGDEMIPSTNYYQENISFHPPNFEAASEPGTCSQAVESLLDTIFDINSPIMGGLQLDSFLNEIRGILYEGPNECQSNPAIVSFCNISRERWRKVSKLLRRNSVRERISLSQGIQPLKKQRCC